MLITIMVVSEKNESKFEPNLGLKTLTQDSVQIWYKSNNFNWKLFDFNYLG